MKNRMPLVTLGVCAALLIAPVARSQEPSPQQKALNPLEPFTRLVGGQWHLEGSYQEFEWGVGRRSVRSRSYFLIDGTPKLVSEGIWYWHPGENRIKGVFTAIDMPFVLLDYTTRFEGDRLVSDFTAYGPSGDGTTYVETWDLRDATHYDWKLYRKTPDGLREEMGGTYANKQ